jgi:hypothetical protein
MVFGVVGVIIPIVLLHVVVVLKHELEFVIINLMEDNHAMVPAHKQFHAIQISLVQVWIFPLAYNICIDFFLYDS